MRIKLTYYIIPLRTTLLRYSHYALFNCVRFLPLSFSQMPFGNYANADRANDGNSDDMAAQNIIVRVQIASAVNRLTGLVVRNLRLANVPMRSISRLCRLANRNEEMLALSIAGTLTQVPWNQFCGDPQDIVMVERYCWMDKVHNGQEAVNLANFPGLTQDIVDQYKSYLDKKRQYLSTIPMRMLPIMREYAFFYTGWDRDNLKDVDKAERYRQRLQQFYDNERGNSY